MALVEMRKKHLTEQEAYELSIETGKRLIEVLDQEQLERLRALLACGENADAWNLSMWAHHLWKNDSPHKKLKMLLRSNVQMPFAEWLWFQISLLNQDRTQAHKTD